MTLLEVKNLKKIYTTRFGASRVQALSDVSFSVEKGEYVAIMGESGSGKTTLLNILAALDKPSGGTVLLNGRDIKGIKERRWLHSEGRTWASSSRSLTCWIRFLLKIIFICPLYLQARNTDR